MSMDLELLVGSVYRLQDVNRKIGALQERKRLAQEVADVLVRVSEYLDDRADTVDGEDGPLPNAAMSLGQEVDALLAKLKEAK